MSDDTTSQPADTPEAAAAAGDVPAENQSVSAAPEADAAEPAADTTAEPAAPAPNAAVIDSLDAILALTAKAETYVDNGQALVFVRGIQVLVDGIKAAL